jgi:hypothetical protein
MRFGKLETSFLQLFFIKIDKFMWLVW